MRFKSFLLVAACAAAMALSTGVAQADNYLTTPKDLKQQGIDTETFFPACFAPDGRSIAGYFVGSSKDIAEGKKYTIAVLDLDSKNKVTNTRLYKVNVPFFEQMTFTPDSQDLIFTSRAGATFQKLHLATGEVTVLMEHKNGEPGFRCYPLVLAIYGDKVMATGYFYDKDNYGERNALAFIDPNKTGVEAFTKIAEIQKAQNKSHKGYTFYHENLTSPNYAFLVDSNDAKVDYRVWKVGDDTLKLKAFDSGVEDLTMWGSGDRLLYSVKKGDKAHDLVVYDASNDTKYELATGTETPYMSAFLSNDGTTALFSTLNKKGDRSRSFYARESEGWQIKPIKGYHERQRGLQRISPDGKRMFLYTEKGINVFDIVGEK